MPKAVKENNRNGDKRDEVGNRACSQTAAKYAQRERSPINEEPVSRAVSLQQIACASFIHSSIIDECELTHAKVVVALLEHIRQQLLVGRRLVAKVHC